MSLVTSLRAIFFSCVHIELYLQTYFISMLPRQNVPCCFRDSANSLLKRLTDGGARVLSETSGVPKTGCPAIIIEELSRITLKLSEPFRVMC